MNRVVYPYLEKALIHYGIGNRVTMTFANGKYLPISTRYETWTYTDPEGQQHTFNDVHEYQSFHALHSPIVFTNVNEKSNPVRRLKAEF
jgi:hypothetical protein